MPFKNPEKVRARRSVAARLERFTAMLASEFKISSDELLRRAEDQLNHGARPSLAMQQSDQGATSGF